MPRITYRDRLQALIDNPDLDPSDLIFVESLLSFYNRKGKLTPGRARIVRELEDRWSADAIVARKEESPSILARIERIKARAVGTWDADFLQSLKVQINRGRPLTDRQMDVFVEKEEQYSDEAMAAKETWQERYKADATLRLAAVRAARYYRTTGYFSALSRRVLDEPGFVPTQREYAKIVENKYAQKVIAAYEAPPKFPVGAMVTGGAGIHNMRGVHVRLYNKAMVVIQNDGLPVINAAKGTRCYKVLPVGSATTYIIEERWLKTNRRAKKMAKATAK